MRMFGPVREREMTVVRPQVISSLSMHKQFIDDTISTENIRMMQEVLSKKLYCVCYSPFIRASPIIIVIHILKSSILFISFHKKRNPYNSLRINNINTHRGLDQCTYNAIMSTSCG